MSKKIIWTERAKRDIRAIDRDTALDILHSLARFVFTEIGDIKCLQGVDPPEFRLRVGDYRIRFSAHHDAIEILTVQHRSEAYR